LNAWMVRAEGGELIEQFEKGVVALGWGKVGDLTSIKSKEELRGLYAKAYPDLKPGRAANDIGMLYKFRMVLSTSDRVVSYDPSKREYLVGTVLGDYRFDPATIQGYPHIRSVRWDGKVSRDLLPVVARNSLGSTLTLFAIDADVWASIQERLSGDGRAGVPEALLERAELEETREDAVAKAHELIKDQLLRLDDAELEFLAAAMLRAMGYKTRVTPRGPDRGVDVFASPDWLGFQEPRIKAEVKHRPRSSMGSQDLRSFIGGLRDGERGLYVSTGGFTKEARYEAERSKVPVTLLDLDQLVSTIVAHYESFDSDGRALLPLVRVYWPAVSSQ
jgi:restriction system protein